MSEENVKVGRFYVQKHASLDGRYPIYKALRELNTLDYPNGWEFAILDRVGNTGKFNAGTVVLDPRDIEEISAKELRAASKEHNFKVNTGKPDWIWVALLIFVILINGIIWLRPQYVPKGHEVAVIEDYDPNELYRVVSTDEAFIGEYKYLQCDEPCVSVWYSVEENGKCCAVQSSDGIKMVDLDACEYYGPAFELKDTKEFQGSCNFEGNAFAGDLRMTIVEDQLRVEYIDGNGYWLVEPGQKLENAVVLNPHVSPLSVDFEYCGAGKWDANFPEGTELIPAVLEGQMCPFIGSMQPAGSDLKINLMKDGSLNIEYIDGTGHWIVIPGARLDSAVVWNPHVSPQVVNFYNCGDGTFHMSK